MSNTQNASCLKMNESDHHISDAQELQISDVEPLSAIVVDTESVNATSAETKADSVERVVEEQEYIPVSSDQDISKSRLLQESVTTQKTDGTKEAEVLENVEDQKKDLIRAEQSRENLAFPDDEIATAEKAEASAAIKDIVYFTEGAVAEGQEVFGSVRSIAVTAEGVTADEHEDSAVVKNVVESTKGTVTKLHEASATLQIVVDSIKDVKTKEQEAVASVKIVVVDSTEDAVTEGPEVSAAVQSVDAAEDMIAEEQEATTAVKDIVVDSVVDSVAEFGASATIKSADAVEDGIVEEASAAVKNVALCLTVKAVTMESETSAALKSVDAAEDVIAKEHLLSTAVGTVVACPTEEAIALRIKTAAAVERVDSDDYVTAKEREDSVIQDVVADLLRDSATERSEVSQYVKVDTEDSTVDERKISDDVKNVIELLEQAVVEGHEVCETNKNVGTAENVIAKVHGASASVEKVDTVAEETEAASATVKDDALGAVVEEHEIFFVGCRRAYYDTAAIFREMNAAKYSDHELPAWFRPHSFDYLFKKRLRVLNELALATENMRKFMDYYKRVPQPASTDESGYVSRVTIATERAIPSKPDITELGEDVNDAWIDVQQSLRVVLRETKDLLLRQRQESPNLQIEDVELYLETFYALRAHLKNLQTHTEVCRPDFRYDHNMMTVITNVIKLTISLESLLLSVYFDLSKICNFERRSTRGSTKDLSDFLIFC